MGGRLYTCVLVFNPVISRGASLRPERPKKVQAPPPSPDASTDSVDRIRGQSQRDRPRPHQTAGNSRTAVTFYFSLPCAAGFSLPHFATS